jgi:hypothetical protein
MANGNERLTVRGTERCCWALEATDWTTRRGRRSHASIEQLWRAAIGREQFLAQFVIAEFHGSNLVVSI